MKHENLDVKLIELNTSQILSIPWNSHRYSDDKYCEILDSSRVALLMQNISS